jgi:leishmanolysin-like peptidase
MAHVLGHIEFLFKFFREPDGTPRTPHDEERGAFPLTQQKCVNNGTVVEGIFPSSNTLRLVEHSDGRLFQYFVTPRVKQVARNLLNCQSLEGARLVDHEDCIGTHWHERHFIDELMGPVVSQDMGHVLSPLTLALFEDSGWYRVDYRNSDMPAYGIGAGCDFANADCIINNQVPSWASPNEFCSTPMGFKDDFQGIDERSLNKVLCDPTYTQWAACDLFQFREDAPSEINKRRYFSNPLLGPLFFDQADSCPVPVIGLGLDCTRDDPYVGFYNGESVGASSRCFTAFYNDRAAGTVYRPACMQVICDCHDHVVRIGKQVCSFDGEVVAIPGEDDAFLECPRLAAVCPELFSCPLACSGRGICEIDSMAGTPVCECSDSSNDDIACSDLTAYRFTPRECTYRYSRGALWDPSGLWFALLFLTIFLH